MRCGPMASVGKNGGGESQFVCLPSLSPSERDIMDQFSRHPEDRARPCSELRPSADCTETSNSPSDNLHSSSLQNSPKNWEKKLAFALRANECMNGPEQKAIAHLSLSSRSTISNDTADGAHLRKASPITSINMVDMRIDTANHIRIRNCDISLL